VGKFKINPSGMAALERQVAAKMAIAEKAANEAAAMEDTIDAKVEAFARTLEQHGVQDVKREVIRRQLEG